MSKYTLDSSVWISYIGGKDKKIQDIVENNDTATSTLAVAEVCDVLLRRGEDPQPVVMMIKDQTMIVPLTIDQSQHGATIKNTVRQRNSKFGLADGIHLAVALSQRATLLTLDNDFRGLKNAKVL